MEKRLDELPKEMDISPKELGRRIRAHSVSSYAFYTNMMSGRGTNPRFYTLGDIADALGLIPVLLYTQDGKVETLGHEGIIYGETVEDYVGLAVKKHRETEGLTAKDFRGVHPATLSQFQTGARKNPSIKAIENMCLRLRLTPSYLIKPLERKGMRGTDIDSVFNQAIEVSQEYMVAGPERLDLTAMEKLVGYLNQIAQLSPAMQVRYDLLKGKK